MSTADDVRGWLIHLPELAALLPLALVVGPATQIIRTSSEPGSRALANLELLALLDTRDRWAWRGPRGSIDPDRMGLIPHLDTWARDLAGETHDAGWPARPLPDEPNLIDAVNWLLQDGLLDWAEEHAPQWPEFADDMRSCYQRTLAAVHHLRDEKHQDRDATCAACHRGRLRLTRWHDTPAWECDHCELLVTVTPVTIPEAARRTRASERTIRHWAKQGDFTRILGDDGRTLYDLGQIAGRVARSRFGT